MENRQLKLDPKPAKTEKTYVSVILQIFGQKITQFEYSKVCESE